MKGTSVRAVSTSSTSSTSGSGHLVRRTGGWKPRPRALTGGYVARGFDDLDWLPDPRVTEADGDRVELVTGPGEGS